MTVWFAQEGDMLWLRTDGETDWHRNLVAEPDCRVVIDGRELRARYEPSANKDADLKHLVELWRAKYGSMWVQDWYFERGRSAVRLRIASPVD